jgi:hypothetical protein
MECPLGFEVVPTSLVVEEVGLWKRYATDGLKSIGTPLIWSQMMERNPIRTLPTRLMIGLERWLQRHPYLLIGQ